jgi:hypothetical protein
MRTTRRSKDVGRPPGGPPATTPPVTTPETASPLSDPEFVSGLRSLPSGRLGEHERRQAADIVGSRPDGSPVEVRIADLPRPLLVAFLHTRCDGCHHFWRGLRDGADGLLPGAVDAVIVTKGAGPVEPGEVARLSRGITRVPVVMSDRAWADYRVLGYPFFAVVDPASGTVVAETVGLGWTDVTSVVAAATGPLSGPG